jgi:hypothetical protein
MEKQVKKKSTISKKKKKSGKKKLMGTIPGTKIKKVLDYHHQDPRIDIFPEPQEDFEKVSSTPKDKASKLKYPPPRKHPTFRCVWAEFIDNVTSRENFKVGHLRSLEILCDLHVEYEELREFIRINGRSYKSLGRSGEVWKFFPEVTQLTKVQAQIKEYMKMMDLLLKKDHSIESGGEKDEWE